MPILRALVTPRDEGGRPSEPLLAAARGRLRWLPTLRRVVAHSGSSMGAAKRRHVRSDAVIVAASIPMTCGDVVHQRLCRMERLVRDEEAAGSNPATPTTKLHVAA